MRRLALVLAVVGAAIAVPAAPAGAAGLTPAQLHQAYSLPTKSPVAQTIAVVVAYDAPTAAQDLTTYTKRFGIPACTAQSGCFRKVNQRGDAAPLPGADPTGGAFVAEAALGIQTARGVCQNCRVLLVEADTDSRGDLGAAVATAVRLGADEVATAYLLTDDGSDRGAYDHPGVAITAAAGDDGFFEGANYPASLPGVVAVGGTRLTRAAGGGYGSEAVWDDGDREVTTSGCSPFTPVPAWQTAEAALAGCGGRRSVADVAAVASPGAEVYSSTRVSGLKGWIEAGGTSFASPLIAGVYALAGGVPAGTAAPEALYASFRARTGGLHDVTRGSNGSCGGPICTARKGYDGPTGIGTPAGVGAFLPAGTPRLNPGKPRVTVPVAGGRVRAAASGSVRVPVANANGLAVTTTLRLRTASKVRVGSSSRVVTLGSAASASVAKGAKRTLTLRLSSSNRALLRRLGSVKAVLSTTVRDRWGTTATVTTRLTVQAPR